MIKEFIGIAIYRNYGRPCPFASILPTRDFSCFCVLLDKFHFLSAADQGPSTHFRDNNLIPTNKTSILFINFHNLTSFIIIIILARLYIFFHYFFYLAGCQNREGLHLNIWRKLQIYFCDFHFSSFTDGVSCL